MSLSGEEEPSQKESLGDQDGQSAAKGPSKNVATVVDADRPISLEAQSNEQGHALRSPRGKKKAPKAQKERIDDTAESGKHCKPCLVVLTQDPVFSNKALKYANYLAKHGFSLMAKLSDGSFLADSLKHDGSRVGKSRCYPS